MKLKRTIFLFFLVTLPLNLFAAKYTEGVDYIHIETPLATNSKINKIEVTEYFWYGCLHCFKFLPFIEEWLATNPENIDFKTAPAIFRESWASGAQTFYAASQLGVLKEVNLPLFKTIHLDGTKWMEDPLKLALFFEKYKVSSKAVCKAWNSDEVKIQLEKSREYSDKINGVPAMIVNGKYLVDLQTARGKENIFKIVEYLVEKENNLYKKELK